MEDIVRPIASRKSALKPTLVRQIDSYSSVKHTLVLSFASFLISIFLHVLFHLYHCFYVFRRLIPKALSIKHTSQEEEAYPHFRPCVAFRGADPPPLTPNQRNCVFLFNEANFQTLMRSAASQNANAPTAPPSTFDDLTNSPFVQSTSYS